MNGSGIEHLKYFENSFNREVIICFYIFRIQQSCHLECSPVQRKLLIYKLLRIQINLIKIDVGAKPFVNNK
ncbi:MAG TPA: hypothetical protein VLM43_07955, partial [Desulfobacterales bacterium]|nr:hypothetical protein [Desulfobacterales bacterium]